MLGTNSPINIDNSSDYRCRLCHFTSTRDEVIFHIIDTHNLDSGSDTCNKCHTFTGKDTLIHQLRAHFMITPKSCPHCGAVFAIQQVLVKHLRICKFNSGSSSYQHPNNQHPPPPPPPATAPRV